MVCNTWNECLSILSRALPDARGLKIETSSYFVSAWVSATRTFQLGMMENLSSF